MLEAVWLIPALPLLGFALLVVAGRRLGEPWAGWLATLMVGGSFVAGLVTFAGLVDLPEEERQHVYRVFTWMPAGGLDVDLGFLVDPLSMTMVLFVTGVGTLIHLYSIGYMHGDPGFSRFFAYLNLFAFSMLMLVLGDNLLVTFARALNDVGGQVVVFFVLVVAAAEVVVGLGIIVAILRRQPGADADDINVLKG